MKLQLSDFDAELLADLRERLALPERRTRPYTLAEAADALNVSAETIRLRVHAGLIRRVEHVGAVRIPASEIERLTK